MKNRKEQRPGSPSPSRRQEQCALEVLRSAFRAAGWNEQSSRGRSRPDLICRKGEQVYVVELKASAGRARRPVLHGLLADAILRARAMARGRSITAKWTSRPLPARCQGWRFRRKFKWLRSRPMTVCMVGAEPQSR